MSGPAWAVLLGTVAVLAVVAVWCVARANRLDRLHVRTDAARAALLAALEVRATLAVLVAAGDGSGAPAAGPDPDLGAAAHAARRAPTGERAAAENVLGRELAGVERTGLPGVLADELADAEQRVPLARRVYNDAVRDTLGLRSRRLVRWLRLAGTAPLPAYFDIADPVPPDPAERAGAHVARRRPPW